MIQILNLKKKNYVKLNCKEGNSRCEKERKNCSMNKIYLFMSKNRHLYKKRKTKNSTHQEFFSF